MTRAMELLNPFTTIYAIFLHLRELAVRVTAFVEARVIVTKRLRARLSGPLPIVEACLDDG